MTTDNLHIRQSYAYAVARIRQAENGLLERSRIARMLDVPSAGDVFKILGETEYAESIDDLPAGDYERVLDRELERVYRFVSEFVPDPAIVDFFRMDHDLHNCKVAFRALYLGIGGQGVWSTLGTVPASAIQQAVAGETGLEALPPHVIRLLNSGFDCLGVGPGEHASSDCAPDREPGTSSIDPQALDIVLDKEHYARLFETAGHLHSPFVVELCRIRIDTANMAGFLRCRRLKRDTRFFRSFFIHGGTIPLDVFSEAYGESLDFWVRKMSLSPYFRLISEWTAESEHDDSIAVLERLGRRYLLEFSRTSRSRFFGPEPIVAYLLSKEAEVRDLRAIMVGKMNGLDAGSIRERLSGLNA